MNFSRVSEPPFTDQLNDVPRARKYMATLDQLKRQLTPDASAKERAIYQDAVTMRPDDSMLHQNFAQFLEGIGDLPVATAEQKRAPANCCQFIQRCKIKLASC